MWQSLHEAAQDRGFTVIAVALDHAEAARPWIEAAKPGYPCLIDSAHRVAELYNLVNVPQAVWIDEAGRILRPPETAGSTDGFRRRDRRTNLPSDEVIAERARIKAAYFDAVRDWALHGQASPHLLDAQGVQARLSLPGPEVAQAHAHFRLGQALQRAGLDDEARAQFDQATRLHPDSWAMWRQAAPRDPRGLAVGAEFWARVDALGDKPYYAPIEILAGAPASHQP